jgi:cardiolipin synthase A/B
LIARRIGRKGLSQMAWLDLLNRYWPFLVAVFTFLAALLASMHALLYKRETRAALLWLVCIWLLPLFGPILYLSFGVNRINRRVKNFREQSQSFPSRPVASDMGESRAPEAQHLRTLARVGDVVTQRPLTGGNRVQPLLNGDQAFPEMLAAIDAATKSITLVTYIFDADPSGKEFAAALARAVKRGVAVRVLIDDAGVRYSWPSILRDLNRGGVTVGRFLPTFPLWHFMTMNLRNHRKALIVDGKIAFTGGMNIRHGNVLKSKPKAPVQDLHFRVEGPVVEQLQDAFVMDWGFATKENLDGPLWFPEIADCGNIISRVITDGPDDDLDKFRWALLAALAEAQTSVQILTPYFLPDTALVTALNLAAMRGARVDIILPSVSNLPYVHWASRAMWWQVLEHGCHLWLTPPPFDHSKLVVVDGHWVCLGSANWDPRSLRLNFEMNVECYGRELGQQMEALVQEKMRGAREVTMAEADGRSLPCKLRDATARLFMPYL